MKTPPCFQFQTLKNRNTQPIPQLDKPCENSGINNLWKWGEQPGWPETLWCCTPLKKRHRGKYLETRTACTQSHDKTLAQAIRIKSKSSSRTACTHIHIHSHYTQEIRVFVSGVCTVIRVWYLTTQHFVFQAPHHEDPTYDSALHKLQSCSQRTIRYCLAWKNLSLQNYTFWYHA